MRIVLIALLLLSATTAAKAQLFGPEDTPERIAQIRSHCEYQPDPRACHQYLDAYGPTKSAWRREMDYLERSLNSGFTNPGGGGLRSQQYAPPPVYRHAAPMPMRLCLTPRGVYVPCR